VLFDTGMGIASIPRVVESLTTSDVLVVNSHYHFDHVGGNTLFQRVAIHAAGREPLGQDVPVEWISAYGRYAEAMLEAFRSYKDVDDQFFRLLTPWIEPRSLPDGFDVAAWRTQPTVPTELLRDGDVLDLGARTLQFLHTPGHTRDCICLFDQQRRQLFARDTLATGQLYAHLPDSDLAAFTRSTRRLADEIQRQVDVVYPAHVLRYAAPAEFISETADGFARVSDGSAQPRPGTDIFGNQVREFWFDTFSITLPA
jgi:glyoxylase-like metal-dependent hydrolase (beta-lactamase superfamily II)